MEPTKKSPEVESVLNIVSGKSRAETIGLGRCTFCDSIGNQANKAFRDELSEKEYCISGMCQECQDKVFLQTCEVCYSAENRETFMSGLGFDCICMDCHEQLTKEYENDLKDLTEYKSN